MNDTFITDYFKNSNTESQHEKEASVALNMKTGQVRYQGILLPWSVK